MKISEQGIQNLGKALAQFQDEVKNPSNTATNPQFRSKYAPLDVVINTAKPILAKNGLSFVQSTGAVDESITVTTLLIHESGEWIESDPLILPAYQIKGGGAKEFNAQGAGSSLTYARRYSLSAILGLSSEDDDDANGQVFGNGGNGTTSSGGSQSKGNSTPSNTSSTTPTAKEKAIQAAKDRAAAASAGATETKTETPQEPVVETPSVPEETASEGEGSVEKINGGQLKAIGNMVTMIVKKNKLDKDELITELVSKFGKANLEELSFDEGRQVVADINAKMRG